MAIDVVVMLAMACDWKKAKDLRAAAAVWDLSYDEAAATWQVVMS